MFTTIALQYALRRKKLQINLEFKKSSDNRYTISLAYSSI